MPEPLDEWIIGRGTENSGLLNDPGRLYAIHLGKDCRFVCEIAHSIPILEDKTETTNAYAVSLLDGRWLTNFVLLNGCRIEDDLDLERPGKRDRFDQLVRELTKILAELDVQLVEADN